MIKAWSDYSIWQAVLGLLAIFDIISVRLICGVFVARKLYKKQLTPNMTPHII